MNYLFPIAFTMNTFAMTALMVILGVSGHTHLAANVGIVQGAIAALFLSFSANARSIVLNPTSSITADSIFQSRLVLILPLAVMSYILSVLPSEADRYLIIALILRRCVEWISEIHLSEKELSHDKQYARRFSYLQAAVFIIAITWLLGDFPMSSLGLLIWALAPILMSVRYIRDKLKKPLSFHHKLRLMLPQLGSTMIIGIALYVFRLIILLITGKETAGILFTAFALGGIIGSVYAQVLGPSVVLYEDRQKKSFFSWQIRIILGLTITIGIVLFVLSQMNAYGLIVTMKSYFFWGSIGASLVGGVIMVYAQHIRFRFLQLRGDNNLFGPDLLMNLIMIAGVPYLYYIAGRDSLMTLYMINAMLAYVFYWSAVRQDVNSKNYYLIMFNKIIMMVIPFIILLPVFFQIKSGIFQDRSVNYDSGGILSNLPIPLSVLACYLGVLLVGKYRCAYRSLNFIFFSVITMLIASFISAGNQAAEISAKLIFLLQYVLPMFALVLGQLYESEGEPLSIMYKMFFCVIVIIVPLQLLSTLMRGTFYLSPSVYLFSVYQHSQYVPIILVSAYLLVLYGLWQLPNFRRVLLIFIPIIAVYAVASHSISSMLLLFLGIMGLAIYNYGRHEKYKVLAINLVIAMLLSISCLGLGKNCNGYIFWGTESTGFLYFGRPTINGYLYLGLPVDATWQKYGFVKVNHLPGNTSTIIPLLDKNSLNNITARTAYWKYYFEKSVSGIKIFMFGSSQRPDRKLISSAHNYYLDLLYNFGFISLIPILIIIALTAATLYRCRRRVFLSSEIFCVAFVVMFLLLINNSMSVGLRQPYPGIFTFFIWGILLSKLEKMNSGQLEESASLTN